MSKRQFKLSSTSSQEIRFLWKQDPNRGGCCGSRLRRGDSRRDSPILYKPDWYRHQLPPIFSAQSLVSIPALGLSSIFPFCHSISECSPQLLASQCTIFSSSIVGQNIQNAYTTLSNTFSKASGQFVTHLYFIYGNKNVPFWSWCTRMICTHQILSYSSNCNSFKFRISLVQSLQTLGNLV